MTRTTRKIKYVGSVVSYATKYCRLKVSQLNSNLSYCSYLPNCSSVPRSINNTTPGFKGMMSEKMLTQLDLVFFYYEVIEEPWYLSQSHLDIPVKLFLIDLSTS